ncbi:hypothetical protein VNO77_42441 [Canavalia gladiata]|uniref:Uncharacterized protein n=1 Tax=Canavalia gladiata TaxID=3824 RepID=A0AAN9JSA3_CANGL
MQTRYALDGRAKGAKHMCELRDMRISQSSVELRDMRISQSSVELRDMRISQSSVELRDTHHSSTAVIGFASFPLRSLLTSSNIYHLFSFLSELN